MKSELRGLPALALRQYGMDISTYDESFLEKAIETRMATLGAASFAAYRERFGCERDEAEALFASLRICYSEFFRNPLAFVCLEQIVLPALIDKKKLTTDRELRIWSAACAQGQEIYSVAILCDELLAKDGAGLSCRFFASDIDGEALAAARSGIYSAGAVDSVTLKRTRNYFRRNEDSYCLDPRIVKTVEFSVFNLLAETGACPPISIYGNFDLVLCSNILFYYKPEYRKRIIGKIESCIAPGGYLITGEAERGIVAKFRYREAYPASAIFRLGDEGARTR